MLGLRATRRQQVHFLHIGKTGGTQLVGLLGKLNGIAGRELFVSHPHGVRLGDLPPKADYIFSVRGPVSRFRSAFYSRKRQGRPAYDVPWRPDEAIAFAAFPEANDLAEALAEDGKRGEDARAAIQSIQHAAQHQIDWFTPQGFFLDRRPPLAIFRQEALAGDFARFAAALGAAEPPQPSDDPVRGHVNDYTGTPPLSDKAVEALEAWYGRDVSFHRRCCDWAAAPPSLPDWLTAAFG